MARVLEFRRKRLEPVGADAIAGGREFELDHFGAHLSQQPRAGWPRDELGEIQNPVVFQHLRLVRHLSSPVLCGSPSLGGCNRQSRSSSRALAPRILFSSPGSRPNALTSSTGWAIPAGRG